MNKPTIADVQFVGPYVVRDLERRTVIFRHNAGEPGDIPPEVALLPIKYIAAGPDGYLHVYT